MKKGRHRRFEEARALKRSHDVDLEDLFEDISDGPEAGYKPEHDAWADLAEEWNSRAAAESAEEESDDESEVDEEDATSSSEAAS